MFPSLWNLRNSSKIYSSLLYLFKFACCWLFLADVTVHDNQHAGRQRLIAGCHLSSVDWNWDISAVPWLGNELPCARWSALSFLTESSANLSLYLGFRTVTVKWWCPSLAYRQASFQWADKACNDRRIIIFSALQADYKRQHWTVSRNILWLVAVAWL